jgi:hypothetical protein
MVALILCAGAFLLCYFAGRRSLVAGIAAVVGVGYVYGILRANVPTTFSHFIFDAAVVGLYAAQLLRRIAPEDRARMRRLVPWVTLLIGWPVLLLLLPIQDPMIQLVGLRAHIFLLPFLLFGARLHRQDIDRLVLWLAFFNVVAFAFAVAEFVFGVHHFYPRNQVTELIYRSNDVHTGNLLGALRIPATFANASSYGGAMIITLPFLIGAWVQKQPRLWHRALVAAGLAAAILGVFLAASRVHFLVLVPLVLISMLSGRLGMAGRLGWVGMLLGLSWVISMEARLFQRFLALNVDTMVERFSWGVNESLLELLFRYPLGNGLGGGGTSVPYFLQHLIRNPIGIENQYGMILLEQGIPGLLIWLAFIVWVLTRQTTPRRDPWYLGRRLAWYCLAAYFAQGLIGVGLLTSIPFTALFLVTVGWIVVRQAAPSSGPAPAAQRVRVPEPVPGPDRASVAPRA